MGEKQNMEDKLVDLQNQLYALAEIKQEVWSYHPSNPDFINPISLYESLNIEINEIECKINDLMFRLNSLN